MRIPSLVSSLFFFPEQPSAGTFAILECVLRHTDHFDLLQMKGITLFSSSACRLLCIRQGGTF